MEAWESVVDYDDLKGFQHYLGTFEVSCSSWPTFDKYVSGFWLIPYKEK